MAEELKKEIEDEVDSITGGGNILNNPDICPEGISKNEFAKWGVCYTQTRLGPKTCNHFHRFNSTTGKCNLKNWTGSAPVAVDN